MELQQCLRKKGRPVLANFTVEIPPVILPITSLSSLYSSHSPCPRRRTDFLNSHLCICTADTTQMGFLGIL